MIRNALFGISMLALTAGSAFAATAKHPVAKSHVVAQAGSAAPAADGASADKPAKKASKKSTKKTSKTGGAKEMKTAPETK